MKIPDYLDPAATGVLVTKTQTTTGMGVWVNADGQKCIGDAIWEADTIEPGSHAPEVEAGLWGSGQFEHLPVRPGSRRWIEIDSPPGAGAI